MFFRSSLVAQTPERSGIAGDIRVSVGTFFVLVFHSLRLGQRLINTVGLLGRRLKLKHF